MLRISWIVVAAFGVMIGMDAAQAEEPKGGQKPKSGYGQDAPAKPPAEAVSQEELEREFSETMSGATLVGSFTSLNFARLDEADNAKAEAGKNGGKEGEKNEPALRLKQDRYTLGKVAKIKDDTWLFESRIQYGDHDLTLPLTIQVKWAGDTPVITLSDLTIPGLGTFSARIVVYRDCYAGMWVHGDHGGQMFGRVVKAKKQ